MPYKLQFGTYPMPLALLPVEEGLTQDLGEKPVPRRPGASTQEPRETPRVLTIRGQFAADTLADWEAAKSDLLNGVAELTADLYFGRDDRYYKQAQLESISIGDPAEGRLYGVIATIGLTFKAARYPEAFGTTDYTPGLNTSGGTVPYPLSTGTAPTLPVWTITLGAGGGSVALTNLTTGETCYISRPAGFSGGDVVVLTRDGCSATRNGTPEAGLVDRQIPRLLPGNNVIQCSVNGAVSVTGLAVTFRGRWK
jgi:hypothetical protein